MLFVGDDRIVMRRIVALDGKKVWTREKINPIRAFDDRSGIEEKRRGGEDSFDLTTDPGFPIVVISREWNKRGWGGEAVNRGERETVWTEIAGRIERASERASERRWKVGKVFQGGRNAARPTGEGNFPWKSSTCPGSSTSSNPEHETYTRVGTHVHVLAD